jgi:hypothetical protein
VSGFIVVPIHVTSGETSSEAVAIKQSELSTATLAILFDIADQLYRRGGSWH